MENLTHLNRPSLGRDSRGDPYPPKMSMVVELTFKAPFEWLVNH